MLRLVRRLRGVAPPAAIAPPEENTIAPPEENTSDADHTWALDAFFSDPAGGIIVQGWRSVPLGADLQGETWGAEIEGVPAVVKAYCQFSRTDLAGYMAEAGGVGQLLGFCLKVNASSDADAITLIDRGLAEPRRYKALRASAAHATLLDAVQGATDEAFTGLLELIVREGDLAVSAEACPPLLDRTLNLPDRLVRGREFPFAIDLAALDDKRGVVTVFGWCVPPRSPDAVEITVLGISRDSVTVFQPEVAVVDRPDLRGLFEQHYGDMVGETVLAGFSGLGGTTFSRPRTNEARTAFVVISITPAGDMTLIRLGPLVAPVRAHYLAWLDIVVKSVSPSATAYVRAQMSSWVNVVDLPSLEPDFDASVDESGLLILVADAISSVKARILSIRLFSDPSLRWLELAFTQVDPDVARALLGVQRMIGREARVRTVTDAGALLQAKAGPLSCNVVIATASELLSMTDETLHSLRLTHHGVRIFGDSRLSEPSAAFDSESEVKLLLDYYGPFVGVAAGVAWASLAPLSSSLGVTFETFVKEAAVRASKLGKLHLAAPFTRAGDSYSYRGHPQDRHWAERVVRLGDGMLLERVADESKPREGKGYAA